jgi:hypothetical protein
MKKEAFTANESWGLAAGMRAHGRRNSNFESARLKALTPYLKKVIFIYTMSANRDKGQ